MSGIEEQRILCHELYAVTRDQLESLEHADYERLQMLLDKRQALLDRLVPLEALPAKAGKDRVVDHDHFAPAREEIARLLREILVMDHEARDRMEAQRSELQSAIREVRHGREGLAGYRHALESSPQLIDQAL